MNEPDLSLGAEFAASTRQDWLKVVDAALKGAPFEKLTAKTQDGLTIEPLYHRAADACPLGARPPGTPWALMQRVEHPDPVAANSQARHDLENGANGLSLVFAGAVGAYSYGLDPSRATLARALDGIVLDAGIRIELDLGARPMETAQGLAALVRSLKLEPGTTDIRFALDPLGAIATSGATATAWADLAPLFASTVADLLGQGFNGPFAAADGRPVHAAGGSQAQELAFALSAAVSYLRTLETHGVDLETASRMVAFRLAADADQFLTIAKFRAVRKLWARVMEACGLPPQRAVVSAETAWRMLTRRDPWVNLLRATMAVFAAGLGGADNITVLPFTAALGLPDQFARRLARNTQLILLEESNLAKVADAGAGAGAVENLTNELCRAAWSLFQEIEAAGGTATALARGLVQEKVATVRAAQEEAVARRNAPLTGTSEFPDIKEVPVAVLDVAPVAAPALAGAVTMPPLARIRFAEPFERLRDASDRRLAETGERPKVFLANLGRLSDFTARATFAKNFFEAGGIEAVTNEGFADRAEMIAAFKRSGAPLACLCSSDDVFGREAIDAASALREAGAQHLYLAGRPKDLESYTAVGIETFIYFGCDALATLQAVHRQVPAPPSS